MRLVGYVDGIEVRFDFCPPSTFKAEIPRQLDGTYILQLRAIDDAGNETNYSNIFIKIDFQQLKIQILPINYSCIENGVNMAYRELNNGFNVLPMIHNFSTHEIVNYCYRELVMQ
jgi:hypothetical protein